MEVRLGVHESVSVMFPAEVLRDAIDPDGDTVEVVDGAADITPLDAVVTFGFDEAFLEADLRWVHSTQAGVDKIPVGRLADHGVAVTNSTGIHGESAGETVAGYMLMLARGLHRHVRSQVDREWGDPAWDSAFTLAGESVCVVGLGGLGRGIAQRADALGMHVTGVRRTPLPVGHVDRVYTSDDLDEAIADARFVVLAVPLTDETERLIGPDELAAMRGDAYLVNVARGEVVDQSALVAALDEGTVAGAALDVFETEPLPADSPLWDMEDVIVTPHEATDSRGKPDLIAPIVRENRQRLEAGEPLVNRIA